MFEVDETALEQFIVKHPGLRSRTAGHLRSICGLTPHEAAGVIDYLITEGWAPPPEASGSAPAEQTFPVPQVCPHCAQNIDIAKVNGMVYVAHPGYDETGRPAATVVADEQGGGIGNDPGSAGTSPPGVEGAQLPSFPADLHTLRSSAGGPTDVAPSPELPTGQEGSLASVDAVRDKATCMYCGAVFTVGNRHMCGSAPDVPADTTRDELFSRLYDNISAQIENEDEPHHVDAMFRITAAARDACGSAPSELTQNVVNAARQVVSYRTGMEELRQALILFDRSRTSQDDAR